MKEAIVILVVIAIILALTAVRYRKQIASVLHIWRSLKSMRNQMKERTENTKREESIPAGALVNCAKCGKWVAERAAISLRGGTSYCSTACMEKTANTR